MVGGAFKTMYLLSKSDIDNNAKKNFKLSLQNKDICDGGMSVSVRPIKRRRIGNKPKAGKIVQSLKRGDDQFYVDDAGKHEDENDGISKFKPQYHKPSTHIPPSYGLSLRDTNMKQRGLVNHDKPKQNFSTYSQESSTDDGQDRNYHEQTKFDKIELDPRRLKANYRKKQRGDEIKQLKRQRSESESDDENNEQLRDNTTHMEKRQLVNYNQPQQESSTNLDMEESSDGSHLDEKNDDKKYITFVKDENSGSNKNNFSDDSHLGEKNDDKKYITFVKDENSGSYKNNMIGEAEENPTGENSDENEDDIDQIRQGIKYRKKRKGNKLRMLKKRKMIAYAKQLSKNHRRKDKNFDRKSFGPIDSTELRKEDIQSNENTKHKFDNDIDNQSNLEDINLKRRKILDDINKLKDEQWMGRIKSRLNDKRVQFKRKKDTVGYRINTDDVSKSLIKPSDFTYLNKNESADFLDKWRPLKELKSKPFKNKRFKPYY